MPRRPKPATIGAEDRMRANLRQILEEQERSIAWLERRMIAAGCPVGPTVVWKILNRGRKIHCDEAIAIADALDVPLADLIGTN